MTIKTHFWRGLKWKHVRPLEIITSNCVLFAAKESPFQSMSMEIERTDHIAKNVIKKKKPLIGKVGLMLHVITEKK